jgi:hypothetical protein
MTMRTVKEQAADARAAPWRFIADRPCQHGPLERRADAPMLFPRHVKSRGPAFPVNARWLVYHARMTRGEQLLQIVRSLDQEMNNTSVILLFHRGTCIACHYLRHSPRIVRSSLGASNTAAC